MSCAGYNEDAGTAADDIFSAVGAEFHPTPIRQHELMMIVTVDFGLVSVTA